MTLTLQHGSVFMHDDELRMLTRVIGWAQGDHLEIGSMWGGTAIAACVGKEQAGQDDAKVVCIDPFVETDAATRARPTERTFWENIDAAGFRDKVELHVCPSAPWPLHPDRRFGSVLIDGNHTAPWPETDWESARHVTDLILLHDVNWHAPDVARLHQRVTGGSEWRMREGTRFLYAYERIKVRT